MCIWVTAREHTHGSRQFPWMTSESLPSVQSADIILSFNSHAKTWKRLLTQVFSDYLFFPLFGGSLRLSFFYWDLSSWISFWKNSRKRNLRQYSSMSYTSYIRFCSRKNFPTGFKVWVLYSDSHFLSLLCSSLLLFTQRFGRYVFRPFSGVCREPSRNFEPRSLLNPPVYKC